MKFIIDAQLPKSLSSFLNSVGHDSIHTIDLPEHNKIKDTEIIIISENENRIVISKDNDFLESFLLMERPKKLIMINTGNIRNVELISIFENNIDIISKSIEENSLIEINRTELIVHV